MWQRLAKRNFKTNNEKTTTATPSSTPSAATTSSPFSYSSFKDIHQLVTKDQEDHHPNPLTPTTTRKSSVFHRSCHCTSLLSSSRPLPTLSFPGADKRIIFYSTSLRVVRSTFEQCHTVRSILCGLRVSVEERDVAMDSAFLRELNLIFGVPKSKIRLPKVFIGGKYIGGAKEVQYLNETEELKKVIAELPVVERCVCEVCGGYGFIVCKMCSGSRKVYIQRHGFKVCTSCNENGLIRCPSCSSPPFDSAS